MSDESERESPQTVHLAFVNGKYPEEPTKLLGVYEDEEDAESVAQDVGKDWYNWYVQEREVKTGPVVEGENAR